jgi:hypothetical protein
MTDLPRYFFEYQDHEGLVTDLTVAEQRAQDILADNEGGAHG